MPDQARPRIHGVRLAALAGAVLASAVLVSTALASATGPVAALASAAGPVAARASAADSAGAAAAQASVPAAAHTGSLNAITAVSASNLWAVGFSYHGATYAAMTEHWNGHKWAIVVPPVPAGVTDSYLYAVDAVSASDVWAAGYTTTGTAASPLTEYWDGTQWSVVTAPVPAGASGANLYAVDAVSASDVWAAGYTEPSASTLIEHWDGTQWSVVPSPDPTGAVDSWLYGISGSSASDAWAAGAWSDGPTTATLTEHWDGTQWSIVASPSPGGPGAVTALEAVHTSPSGPAWSAGYRYTGSVAKTVTEHWNGQRWKVITSANPAGAQATSLVSLTAVPGGGLWAAGDSTDANSVTSTVAEHWTGQSWKLTPTPNPHGSSDASLTGIAAVLGQDAWAIGYSWNGSATHAIAEHWTGQSWKLVTVPS